MRQKNAQDLFSDTPKIWPPSLLPKALQTKYLKGILAVANPLILVTHQDHNITAKKMLSRAARMMGETIGWHRHCDVCKKPTIKMSKEPMVCAACRIKLRKVVAVSECATCKKEIRRDFCAYVYKVKNGDVASFCGKACNGKWMTLNKLKPDMCVACGKPNKTIQGKYCSRVCSDGAKRTRLGKEFSCTMCGKVFIGGRYNRKTCSKECTTLSASINMAKQNLSWYKNALLTPRVKYPMNFRNKIRKELIRERDLHGCAMCRQKPSQRKQLFIHHIDWIKTNSDIENLICVCRTCHAKGHNDASDVQFDNAKLIHLAQSRTRRMPKAWKLKLAAIDNRYDDDGNARLTPREPTRSRQSGQ